MHLCAKSNLLVLGGRGEFRVVQVVTRGGEMDKEAVKQKGSLAARPRIEPENEEANALLELERKIEHRVAKIELNCEEMMKELKAEHQERITKLEMELVEKIRWAEAVSAQKLSDDESSRRHLVDRISLLESERDKLIDKVSKLEHQGMQRIQADRIHFQKLEVELERIQAEVVSAQKVSDASRRHLADKISSLESARDKLTEKVTELEQRFSKEVAHQDGTEVSVRLQEFSSKELQDATDNFDVKQKCEDGDPHGDVYTGKLRDGTLIKVKKIRNTSSAMQIMELSKFKDDVVDRLRLLHHPHLVTPLGVCYEESCLVYEHMAHGNVKDWIARGENSTSRGSLAWYARFRIMAEVARGLCFLHSYPLASGGPIIHTTDTGALPRRSARLAVRARSVVPPRTKYQQQRLSRRTTLAASSTTLTVPVTTGVLPACPVQGALEPLADYLGRLQVFTDAVATAKAQQEAAEAERQRLVNEAAAQAQQTAEADAAARDRRNAASTESMIQNENQWTTLLQGMFFVPTDAQAEPTQAEAERSNLATVMLSVMRGVMWNNKLLQAHLLTELQQKQKHQQEVAALTAAVRAAATQQQQQQRLLNSTLARINSIEAKASAAPGCTTDETKQLNEHIDHVVIIIDKLGDFTSPATMSSTVAAIKTGITKLQTRPDTATRNYKMPHFTISKFDDYNKTDALTWWQSFLTEASCRTIPADDMMKALYLQLIGGAQAWMNHLAATKKCTIAELHTHITWKEFKQLWFTRFLVRNVVKAAMNEVYTSSQGAEDGEIRVWSDSNYQQVASYSCPWDGHVRRMHLCAKSNLLVLGGFGEFRIVQVVTRGGEMDKEAVKQKGSLAARPRVEPENEEANALLELERRIEHRVAKIDLNCEKVMNELKAEHQERITKLEMELVEKIRGQKRSVHKSCQTTNLVEDI
ncbi:hypothetical protein CBR_g34397 [Chara braunii]|uniref:Protein kinase domain-containing protein n=1 Tax=Chara braunii TaxID=69332 RepID=A0A388LIH7_CHABU|nr:hypothetical protein CBR_g34397 [Chara braunii]|eukprot:GBG82116.1 hypothetical protein CBR_g34397 [Chara braunii]